jgi:hypothetical protein
LIKVFFDAPNPLLQPVGVGGEAAPEPSLLRTGELHGSVRRCASARHWRRDDWAKRSSVLRPTCAFLLVALDGVKPRVRHDRAPTEGDEGERHHQVFRHASHLANRGSPACDGQSGEGLLAPRIDKATCGALGLSCTRRT